jgi:hypothetical protein
MVDHQLIPTDLATTMQALLVVSLAQSLCLRLETLTTSTSDRLPLLDSLMVRPTLSLAKLETLSAIVRLLSRLTSKPELFHAQSQMSRLLTWLIELKFCSQVIFQHALVAAQSLATQLPCVLHSEITLALPTRSTEILLAVATKLFLSPLVLLPINSATSHLHLAQLTSQFLKALITEWLMDNLSMLDS